MLQLLIALPFFLFFPAFLSSRHKNEKKVFVAKNFMFSSCVELLLSRTKKRIVHTCVNLGEIFRTATAGFADQR